MKEDPKLKDMQASIGKVQDQMKDNIELVMARQENIDGIADKSSNLQTSASQFSQAASRIREEQTMQLYRFYAMICFGLVFAIIVFTLWSSPGKLVIAVLIVSILAGVAWFLFHKRRQSTLALANALESNSAPRLSDPEAGRE